MTEFTAPETVPTSAAAAPIESTDDEFDTWPWPHGPIDPDPVKAEIQRKRLMAELFLVGEVRLDPIESAKAMESRTWPDNGDWLKETFPEPWSWVATFGEPRSAKAKKQMKEERAAWRKFMTEARAEWKSFAVEFADTDHETLEFEILCKWGEWNEREPDWPNGESRIKPAWREASARDLLTLIDRDPDYVRRALGIPGGVT
jgi:hypothetical protein